LTKEATRLGIRYGSLSEANAMFSHPAAEFVVAKQRTTTGCAGASRALPQNIATSFSIDNNIKSVLVSAPECIGNVGPMSGTGLGYFQTSSML
jgi:hypothetical protein